ncbi:tripartite tricarboxylate transporter substrate binding protein [Pseudolabrys taiwanensis]|uniref:Tripartite tricarboxylate transporter substrate binding protein n=1 Tax=Pseudolabrys taiwanensis TaxID=331696 RepID=A0A346A1T6_9HYPH|nr:tripartite tricarboxylate transporter substrate binding protein [Pseudolabrys taiwanensis]AXK83133.1 tripartite tricarboxylate transporter substrate binding protein [Pseudolabrys taiwanensis]
MKSTIMSARGALAAFALSFATLLSIHVARAETYPSRTITLVVPYSAGTGIDIAARLLADKMQQRLKQPVIVENRVGAAGNLGSAFVAKAKPDGYTLLLVANTLAMSPSLYDLSYDPLTNLTPVGMLLRGALVLVVNRDVKATSTAELIALAKSAPGTLNYGSPGTGTPQHLAMELLKSATGINVVHIPYKGAADALLGTIRGENSMAFVPVQSALPNLGDGRIRALGISSPVSAPQLANVPTIAAQIHDPKFDVDLWYGLFAPADTPPNIVRALGAELNAYAAAPDVKERLAALALVPSVSSPGELEHTLKSDIVRWGQLIKTAGIARQ